MRARQFTRMLFELHQPMAYELADILDLSRVDRLLGLGGGSGVVSFALLRRYPDLTAVVVDIPNVCGAGRELDWALQGSLTDPEFTYPTAAEIQSKLEGAGFRFVTYRDSSALDAVATTFTDGMVIVDAHIG